MQRKVFGITVKKTDADGSVLATWAFTVACKYVRREFRQLNKLDLKKYASRQSVGSCRLEQALSYSHPCRKQQVHSKHTRPTFASDTCLQWQLFIQLRQKRARLITEKISLVSTLFLRQVQPYQFPLSPPSCLIFNSQGVIISSRNTSLG